jgi:hypothetical protein
MSVSDTIAWMGITFSVGAICGIKFGMWAKGKTLQWRIVEKE